MRNGIFGSGTVKQADRLVAGLSEMADRAQDLIREAGSDIGHRVGDTGSRLSNVGSTVGSAMSDNARYAVSATDSYVRENPWKVLTAGVALGAIVAMLLMRR
jgi:ElaB/YqjD/DUF883 family membrane-anchored ribosome-binding protein